MKKFLLLYSTDVKSYLDQNIDRDIYCWNDIQNISQMFFNNDYDINVISYDIENEKNNIILKLTDYSIKNNQEMIIFNNIGDVVYDDTCYYYLLCVGSGSYEDYYESKIGLFSTRNKAIEEYKNHEITADDILKNNRLYYLLESEEPQYEDYKDESEYYNAYSEYWEDKKCEYIPEDSATCCCIYKLKVID